MLVLTPKQRLTVDDYYHLAKTGVLPPDARVELLDGHIFDMLPIGPFHANAVRRLSNFFARLGQGRWLVDVQNPVRLSSQSEPQPDLVLLRPLDEEFTQRHPTPDDVFLLVEVADSSVRFDREEKLPVYARAGITEFWLVNLVERKVEIYREPLPEGVYRLVVQARGGDRIAPAAFPDVALTVEALLGA